MQPTDADSAFDDLVRRQIIDAYGSETFAGPKFSTEPGSYLWARAEADAGYVRDKAEALKRMEGIVDDINARLAAEGLLPEGCRLEWANIR